MTETSRTEEEVRAADQAPFDLDALIEQTGGAAALHRRSGVSLLTIRLVRRGERTPQRDTAERVATALGVGLDEVRWPVGYTSLTSAGIPASATQVAHQTMALAEPPVAAPVEVPDVEETRRRYGTGEFGGEFYEDGAVRQEIAALVERQQRLIAEQQEITKRLEMFGGQVAGAQTAAQTQDAEGS